MKFIKGITPGGYVLMASLVIGMLLLGQGWLMTEYAWVGFGLFALTPVALVLVMRRVRAAAGVVLGLAVVLAGIGLWTGVALWRALPGLVCVLVAWDLDGFLQRLAFAAEEDNPREMERRHLLQMGLVVLGGLAVDLISENIRFAQGFEWALGLAVLAFVGIGALVLRIRGTNG